MYVRPLLCHCHELKGRSPIDSIKKNWLKLTISTVIVLIIGGFLASRADIRFGKFLEAVEQMGWFAILLAFFGNFSQVLFLILRHDALIPREQHPGYRRVFFGVGMGHTVNMFFPARAGEVLKCLFLSQPKIPGKVTPLSVAGVLVADRVVDITTLVLMAVLTHAYVQPQIQERLRNWSIPWGWVGAIAVVAVLVGLWFFFFRESSRKARRWGREFRSGLACLARPRYFALALFFAAISWTGELASLVVLCGTQGLQLTAGNAVFVLITISIVGSIPLSLANIGPYEAATAVVLVSLGMGYEQALAVATVHHILQLSSIALWASITLVTREKKRTRAPR
ncbi:flippase-like domain-containing protein [bacterium]|nr:flippase-like domain-containing protein [bacterium]